MNTETPIATLVTANTYNPLLTILSEAKAGSRSAEQARYYALVRKADRRVTPNWRGDRDLVCYSFTMPFGDLLGMADLIANAVWGLPEADCDAADRDHIARVLLGRVAYAVTADRAARQESVELAS